MRRLLQAFDLVATFDDERTEIAGGDVLTDGAVIEAVGTGLAERPDLLGTIDEVVDCRGLVGLPGLVNAHQHLYQGAFRAVPSLERVAIEPWLAGLGDLVKARYRSGRFGPEVVAAVAAAVLSESLLGGVTTVADQHYFFPAGPTLPYVEATIEAAATVGLRLHACRGTLTAGPDPEVTQTVDTVVSHCAGLIDEHHDPSPGAMVRVALAPCGVHVDQPGLFGELAALAADHRGVRLHTHLYEKVDDSACRARYACSPWELLVAQGWAQPRTWLAHVVDPPDAEIDEMAAAGVAIAHLPAPDLRMGWGAAPVRRFLDAGPRWDSAPPDPRPMTAPTCWVTSVYRPSCTAPANPSAGCRRGSCSAWPPAAVRPASVGMTSGSSGGGCRPTSRRGTLARSTGSASTTRWPVC